jgi:L-2-amino-thiazoline-4-carboxylic acid hydrolase
MTHEMPPDTLNEIGVLRRREIEARILAPVINALGAEFGRERVIEIVKRVIVEIAHRQGQDLASQAGGNSIDHFARSKANWVKGGALETEDIALTETTYAYNVARCRYAEMYRALGIPELGAVLSCGRDFALGEGFNPDLKLVRTQTLMEGAPHCDFRYRLEKAPEQR